MTWVFLRKTPLQPAARRQIRSILILVASVFFLGLGLRFFWPLETDIARVLEGPSLWHPWGLDSLGRDLLNRSLQSFSFSLLLAMVASVIAGVLGIGLGAFAGWRGGRTDLFLMRLIEILESVPDLLLAVVIMLAVGITLGIDSAGASFVALSLALGLSSWFEVARQARVLTLRERQLLYAEAAHAIGAGRTRILARHIWPNIQNSIWILLLLQIPSFILFEASLSFFGFGLQPPEPSLGQIFVEGWRVMSVTSHVIWGPSFLLFATLLIFRQLTPGAPGASPRR